MKYLKSESPVTKSIAPNDLIQGRIYRAASIKFESARPFLAVGCSEGVKKVVALDTGTVMDADDLLAYVELSGTLNLEGDA